MKRMLKVNTVLNDHTYDVATWAVDVAIDYVTKDPHTEVVIYDFNSSLNSYSDHLKANDVRLISGSTPSKRYGSFISFCTKASRSKVIFFIGYSASADPKNHMLKMLTFSEIQHREYQIYVILEPSDFYGEHFQQMKTITDQRTNKESMFSVPQPFMKDWNPEMRADFEELYQKYWKFVYKYEVGYEEHFKADDPWFKRSEFYDQLNEDGMHIKVSQGY